MASICFAGARAYAQILDDGRGVVNFKAFAFPFGFESDGWGIRSGIRGNDFQIVGAVRESCRVPGIEFLIEIVLQQLPLSFALAAIVDREAQLVLVVVVSGPEHGSIALLQKPLRRLFESRA